MLKDVRLGAADPTMQGVVRVIGSGPKKIQEGVYICGHWSFEHETLDALRRYDNEIPDGIGEYGVCDSVDQLIAALPKTIASEKPFCISMVEIRRDNQPEYGGWRWHKWGEYIGTQNPQHEYIHDDRHIERVFTYHIYEIILAD